MLISAKFAKFWHGVLWTGYFLKTCEDNIFSQFFLSNSVQNDKQWKSCRFQAHWKRFHKVMGIVHSFQILRRAFWKTPINISGLDKAFYLKFGIHVVLLSNKQNIKKILKIPLKFADFSKYLLNFHRDAEPNWSKPMKKIFFPNFFYPILFNMTNN